MILKLNRYFIGLLLLVGIVFPTVFILLKYFLFFGALLFSILTLISGSIKINQKLFFVSFFFVIIGLVYCTYGLIIGTPGALSLLTVMVAYPLLFPIIAFTYKEGDADRLFQIFIWSAWILVFIDLTYIISNILIPSNFFVTFIENLYINEAIIDNSDEYFKFTLPNISSLIFLLPFFISALFFRTKLAGRVNILILLVCMSVLAILSVRRVLLVAILVGPIIAYIVFLRANSNHNPRQNQVSNSWYIVLFFILVIGFFYYFELFDFYISEINSIFEFRSNTSNIERSLQFDSLVDGIASAPSFGNGAGAAASYSRSSIQPWAYELSYIAFIFQYGIFGFLAYFLGIILLLYGFYRSIVKNGKSSFEYFFFCGFVSFLVANATNPYLAKFDYMWIIFIPFAILLNAVKKENRY